MLNGHMDTGASASEELVDRYAEETRIDGAVGRRVLYGTGMDNMKSGLAATAPLKPSNIAGSLGRRSYCRWRGGSVAPCRSIQGPHFRSKGVGTRYLLTWDCLGL
jgi:hypothetical protein